MNKACQAILGGACLIFFACEKAAPPSERPQQSGIPAAPAPTQSVVAQLPSPSPATATFDACTILTGSEVEAVRASPVTATKGSGRSSQGVTVAQCFYTTAEFSRSVNVAVTRRDAAGVGTRGPRDVWRETFGRFSTSGGARESEVEKRKEEAGERESEQEREEKARPPLRIEGVGEEAFWTSGIGGTLYVLKGEAFLRVSIGGSGTDEAKLDNAKRLAATAVERL